MCVGLEEFGICLGSVRTFGNHVGDWEHLSLRYSVLLSPELLSNYLNLHTAFEGWEFWTSDPSHRIPIKKKDVEQFLH